MSWEESGIAWGARSKDWAYLFEPYARSANETLFDQLGVTSGVRLLDIACGSGFAAALAANRGAQVTGLDASEALIDIARARTPEGDFHVGDMFALPFADNSFDVATSFNGIWKGCEAALVEAHRVVRPGGLIGFTFWGPPKQLGLMPYFATLVTLSPDSHVTATINQGDTGRPGVAEQMVADAGLKLLKRGTATVTNEFPDVELAVRALASGGPSQPALDNVGWDKFKVAMTNALSPLYEEGVGLRISSEFDWVTAEVPQPA